MFYKLPKHKLLGNISDHLTLFSRYAYRLLIICTTFIDTQIKQYCKTWQCNFSCEAMLRQFVFVSVLLLFTYCLYYLSIQDQYAIIWHLLSINASFWLVAFCYKSNRFNYLFMLFKVILKVNDSFCTILLAMKQS